MKKIKTCAVTTLALGALLLIGSLLRSRDSQAKGAYATPVAVTNTSSAPAIASLIDEPGRVPYVSSVLDLGNTCGGGFECDFNFPAVPAGHRLVIEEMSGFVQFYYTPGVFIQAFLSASGGTSSQGQFLVNALTFGNSSFGGSIASYSQPFHAYFDPGQVPEVSWQARNGTFPNDNSTEVATLKGYLIDCSAAPCSAIAH